MSRSEPVPDRMLAAVYRGAGRVEVEELPVPRVGAGEALIRVAACGVCGTDLKKIEYGLQEPPRIFGHETAGTIAALGAGVEGWTPGDRVVVHHHIPCGRCFYCQRQAYAHCPTYRRTGTTAGFEPAGGGFAQYVRAADWIVRRGLIRVPEGVSFDQASMVEPLNTCLKGIRAAGAAAGETALIVGAGPIGLLFCQLARSAGLEILISEPLGGRRDLARELGARRVVDPRVEDVVVAARDLTEGRGADLAVVAVASTAVVETALAALRPGGRLLLFAQTRMGDPLTLDAGQVCALEKTILGSYSADIDLQQEAADLIFSGRIEVSRLITHRIPLLKISEALSLAARPTEDSLKVVVHP